MARSMRAARAVAALPEADPALATLALWCETKDAASPTRTAGDAIHIGPEFETLPFREQIGLLARCILHVAFRHEARMADMRLRMGDRFDEAVFALAAEAVANEYVEQAGHALPRPAATLRSVLAAHPPREGAPRLADWDVERLYHFLRSRGGDAPKRGASGVRRAEQAAFEASSNGECGLLAAEWESRVARARAAPGAAGRGVGKAFEAALPQAISRTPWEIRLRRLLLKAALEEPRRSYARPRRGWIAAEADARRRGGPRPVVEPGTARDARRPRIVVCVDTSGSIPDDALALFAGEAAGVARRTGAETHLLCFDETVYERRVIDAGDWPRAFVDLEFRKGGGTAFVDALAEADRLDPSRIVMLTDLEGEFGPQPRAGVIWASPLPDPPNPPFGETISLAR